VPTGGIPRYTAQLYDALRASFPEDDYRLVIESRTNFVTRRWWLAGLPLHLMRENFDLFHGTDFAVPYLPVRPSVLMLHDLSPWKREPWRAPSARVERRTPALIRLGLPSMIVTPSEAIRREAISMFRLHPSRIAAVPLAASSRFQAVDVPPPATPYFLSLGVLEPRKNLPMLVAAWREVRRAIGIELVLAGRRRFDAPPITEEPGLRLPGPMPEDKLPELYAGATACLLPTFYEGFGLPLLEAMQCGCPVIASEDPALREVSAGAAIHVSAHEPAAWASAMRAVVESPSLRAELKAQGLRRAASFSWERTARLTREIYEEARKRF
jgi:glycosyltransferase involved in cell wall biosynthesis